jgi:ABC-type phosphate transport system substrate-binding protein
MRARAVAVVIACALSQSACGKSVEADVVATALEHFAARSDTMSYHEGGTTLVAPETSQWASGFGRSNAKCAIPQLFYV